MTIFALFPSPGTNRSRTLACECNHLRHVSLDICVRYTVFILGRSKLEFALIMSSRRKSTTPCMVLPSDVVEREEVEEKTEEAKEEKMDKEEVKVGAEEGAVAEELDQAVVIVPTPPETGIIV